MVKDKLIKHDQYVEELKTLIAPNYDSIVTHISLSDFKKRRTIAEIDLIATKGNRIDVYEVKCSYRIYKARKQLKRIKKLFHLPINNFYFYCGNSHLLHLISV